MGGRIRIIVAGVKSLAAGTPGAAEEPALESAARIARAAGAELHVVHAYEPPESALPRGYLPPADPGAREHHARAVARRLGELCARFPDLRVRGHAVEGSAAVTLCEAAARLQADLLVVGATPRERLWRRTLGSTTEGVVRGAGVPVLVLHRPLEVPLRRVLLTTDLSGESTTLLGRGAELARALAAPGAALRLLLVVPVERRYPSPGWEELLIRGSEEALEKAARELGPAIRPRIRTGEPGWQIVHEAEEWDPDLLVLGMHGRSGLRRLWLGGTAAAALRGTPSNVLAVPAAAREAPAPPAAPPTREPQLA